MHELLTPVEMAKADSLTIEWSPLCGYDLMLNAGSAVTAEILARFGAAKRFFVLCGPGNNGGDGYVIARLLHEAGANTTVYALAEPRAGGDAARARDNCPVVAGSLSDFEPVGGDVVIDALFGAGLDRNLQEPVIGAIAKTRKAQSAVVAVDLPSGISGTSGLVLGDAFSADMTVTFFRKKPGHLLYPGRNLCGELVVADIGIRKDTLAEIEPKCVENTPALWSGLLPQHSALTHKYSRGGAAVFSGGPSSTGAARLAAEAAARAGAGAVTVLSPPSAMLVNACHLTSIMLKPISEADDIDALLRDGKTRALLIGPGFGTGERLQTFCAHILAEGFANSGKALAGIVLDADAITQFSGKPEALFQSIKAAEPDVVLTPHEGEFKRLFPDIASDETLSKTQKALMASRRSGAVIILKGADTVIAEPAGRSSINTNGTPVLATAGSGDVLAGIATGLLAQEIPVFEAACAAVWVHGEAGRLAGHGAMAEDIAANIGMAWGGS